MGAKEIAIAFGYMTFKELDALYSVAQKLSPSATIVNVGSGSGTSGLLLAEACPDAQRYTIDISPGGPLGGLENERNAFEGSGLSLPVQLLGESAKIGKNWKGAPIDLIFIDADHSCNGISADLDAWLPNMADNGIVTFHDYGSPNWPCVKQVVDQVMDDSILIISVDTFIGFIL